MSCVAIIDDSLVVRKIVETILGRAGLPCRSFHDGFEALRAFQDEQKPLPDLLLLDIHLPKLDGYDLLRIFKNNPRFSNMVIIVLSSRDGMLDRVKCRLAGAQAYMTKPFRTQDLLALVSSYLPASSSPTKTMPISDLSLSSERHTDGYQLPSFGSISSASPRPTETRRQISDLPPLVPSIPSAGQRIGQKASEPPLREPVTSPALHVTFMQRFNTLPRTPLPLEASLPLEEVFH